MKHEFLEKNIGLMIVFMIIAIAFGSLVELVPLMMQRQSSEPAEGLQPLAALPLEPLPRDVEATCARPENWECPTQCLPPQVTVHQNIIESHCEQAHEHERAYPLLYQSLLFRPPSR